MAGALPVICIFGVQNINLKSLGPIPKFETDEMDCRCYLTDDDLESVLAKDNPVAIASFGDVGDFSKLMVSPFQIRRKWVHFDDVMDLKGKGAQVFNCFLVNALQRRDEPEPLVSVFTPSYKTGMKIHRPYQSLKNQQFKNWEWVIVDDSNDDGETWRMLQGIAEQDYRIRVYKEHKHTGNIGRLKRMACDLAYGDILVELDHDDTLTPDALKRVARAFENQEIGFAYTDFSELFEDGSPVKYGEGWGFGYGSYRDEIRNGATYAVANSPNINAKTIRHIVAAPNHIRSWRTSVYREIGGHNPSVHVADDYEIMVRTFLNTRMFRIPHMCYLQYRNGDTGNTHRARNAEIQRLVRHFSQFYDRQIHERFLELGVDDFVWKDGESSFPRLNLVPNQVKESHCTIIGE